MRGIESLFNGPVYVLSEFDSLSQSEPRSLSFAEPLQGKILFLPIQQSAIGSEPTCFFATQRQVLVYVSIIVH